MLKIVDGIKVIYIPRKQLKKIVVDEEKLTVTFFADDEAYKKSYSDLSQIRHEIDKLTDGVNQSMAEELFKKMNLLVTVLQGRL